MNGLESLPKANEAMVDEAGKPTQPYTRFFARLFAKPPVQEAVTFSASPFLRRYTRDGFVIVEGGTVSLIEYLRGSQVITAYDLGATKGQFVVKNGDGIQITYTVAPTVTFFPD